MVKRVIGYLLLCCFLNVTTTLPAKCCGSNAPVHRHTGKTPARSLTILQHLLDLMDDEPVSSDSGVDVHCSIFNEPRLISIHAAKLACKAGDPAVAPPVVVFASYGPYHGRAFPVPNHYNFLFRLTPF